MKRLLSSFIPNRFQVPVKYAVNAMQGRLEHELDVLPMIVKGGEHAVDVGGNRGVYALRLARIGATVEVFEPNPVCYQILQGWAKGRKGVTVHDTALSAAKGNACLMVPVDTKGVAHDASGSMEHEFSESTKKFDVQTRSLDSFGWKDITFIKIDVEGHEYKVLLGAEKTIENSHPALLIEIEQRHSQRPIEDIFQYIEGLGYRGFFFKERSIQSLAFFEKSSHQDMNCFAGQAGEYINNFLFLGERRLRDGQYRELVQ